MAAMQLLWNTLIVYCLHKHPVSRTTSMSLSGTKTVAIGLLFGFALASVVTVCSCRSVGPPNARTPTEAETRKRNSQFEASDREVSRVLALLDKHDSSGAWRFAVRGLESSEIDLQGLGCVVLLKLQLHDKKFTQPAEALVEDRLVRGKDLSESSKGVLLSYYQGLEGVGGNLTIEYKGIALSKEVTESGRLSAEAVNFCEKQMAKPTLKEKVPAFLILLSAAQLGGKEKDWSVSICRNEADSVRKGQGRLLKVLYEAVSGNAYPEP